MGSYGHYKLTITNLDRSILCIKYSKYVNVVAGTTNEIRFKLDNDSVGLSPDASVPGFKVLGYWVQNTDISLTQGRTLFPLMY